MSISTAEVVNSLKNKDERALKKIIGASRDDEHLRNELSGSQTVWNAFDLSNDLELLLLNNLCASPNAAGPSKAVNICSRLVANLQSGNARQQRLSWQILANLANSASELSSVASEPVIKCFGEALRGSETRLPALHMILTLNSKFKHEATASLAEQGVFDDILDLEAEWFGSRATDLTSRLLDLFEIIIQNGDAPYVYHALRRKELEPSLLRIYDAACAQFEIAPENFVEWLVPQLVDTMTTVSSHIQNNTRSQGLLEWEILIEMLRIAGQPSVAGSYSDLCRPLLAPTVTLLNLCKLLPRRDKLREQGKLKPEDFPLLRTELIPLLSLLVQRQEDLNTASRLKTADFEAQEYVRNEGGLVTVLESCVIDENNPYMKERAIVCLRVLLDHNEASQNFVAQLEAKRVEDPEALAKAGYEATIENGKIRLKNT